MSVPKKNTVTALSLIGMPGSGKSTTGVLLAKSLNKRFIDTDLSIQEETGQTLQTYLDQHGVDQLRKVEEQVVLNTPVSNTVIATGGSVVYGERAMAYLKARTLVVFLDISLELMKTRLGDFSLRGIAKPASMTIEEMFEERLGLYRQYADVTVDASLPTETLRQSIEAACG